MTPQRPWPRTDYERAAGSYDSGRALSLDAISAWRDALTPYFGRARDPILDLGAGTGFFGKALSQWFGVTVLGVEPSKAMRTRAVERGLQVVAGRAEAIPFASNSCAGAWVSKVLHHIGDLAACAGELKRVVQRDAHIVVRNSFADRLGHVIWLRYFPEAHAVAWSRWPTVDYVRRVFGAAGLDLVHLEAIPEAAAPDMATYCERIAKRANSTLTLIEDEAFAAGLERMRAEAQAGIRGPVMEHHDMVVFQRTE